MRVCELMVGDLVLHDGKVIRVDAVHKRKIGYHKTKDNLTWLFSGQFEPIFLTTSILEKNGFESMRVSWGTYELVGVNKRVEMHNDNDWVLGTGNTWCTHIKTSDEEYMIAHCELTYVHELQHILRLCKIDKEIVV